MPRSGISWILARCQTRSRWIAARPAAACHPARRRISCRYAPPADQHLALDGRDHPGHAVKLFDFRGDAVEIAERLVGQAVDAHMPVETEDAVQQFGAEAVHHRHHDDQGGDTQREPGNDRYESFFAPRPQVAQGDHALESVEDHAVSRASADSAEISSRAPLARFLNSTTPFFTPRGPTTTCQGIPIRSMSANFAPARSSRSS